MSRLHELQDALDRAQERLAYCRRQRQAYENYCDGSEQARRTLRKLTDDERRVQVDAGWARHQLDGAFEVEGLGL